MATFGEVPYNFGFIYKIKLKETGDSYVGSSFLIDARILSHKKRYSNYTVENDILESIDLKKFQKKYRSQVLRSREQFYIFKIKPELNSKIALFCLSKCPNELSQHEINFIEIYFQEHDTIRRAKMIDKNNMWNLFQITRELPDYITDKMDKRKIKEVKFTLPDYYKELSELNEDPNNWCSCVRCNQKPKVWGFKSGALASCMCYSRHEYKDIFGFNISELREVWNNENKNLKLKIA